MLRGAYVDRLLEQAEVYNTYGPSETTVCASYYRCNGGKVSKDGTYPIGTPVSGAKICILDADGNSLPDGETGEICIYGDGVSQGYIGEHAEENKAFEHTKDGGICLYQEMPSPDNLSGQCAYLMNIYTCPEFRGRGVGEMIVRWLVGQAVQRNITKIYLETSEPGRKLYEKTGFLDMPDMMKLQTTVPRIHRD